MLALMLAVPPIGWLAVFVGLPLWVLIVAALLSREPSSSSG